METESGGLYLRNRKFIKSRKEKEGKEEISNEEEVEQEKEAAAGQDSGEAGRRRSYASVAREVTGAQGGHNQE